jgi:hypothetical protein
LPTEYIAECDESIRLPAISMEVTVGWLKSALDDLEGLGPKGGLERFAESLDPAWIEEALAATGTASIRRRKLDAAQAVWVVLGMAMYADRSIKAVVDHLGLVRGESGSVAPSAVTKARYRLGAKPLEWLFEKVASAWSATEGLDGYQGLALYGVDGTSLRVDDSDANFEHFGKPGTRAGLGEAGYPQMRVTALLNLSNRLLAGVRCGPLSASERELATELWRLIPDNSLTIIDRGFTDVRIYRELTTGGINRHFMIRLKKNAVYETLETLPDGTVLATIHPNYAALARDPDAVPIKVRIIAYQHEGGEPSRLAVTLFNHEVYTAKALVQLYHERWELEICFDELKTHLLERKECLRSKKPEGVYQELWGVLLVYNLVRREMLLAAKARSIPARRVSFRSSLLWIRDFWTTAWMISPGNVPRALADLRSEIIGKSLLLPERRSERRYPRHVKIKMTRFPRNHGKRAPKTASPEPSETPTAPGGPISGQPTK